MAKPRARPRPRLLLSPHRGCPLVRGDALAITTGLAPPHRCLPVYLLAATPGTERLLAHMFGPRRLNWDNVSPITSTPQRSTPKKKVPRSTTRKSGKKKHVRRALMDLGGNTPGRKAAGLRSAISTPSREVVGAV